MNIISGTARNLVLAELPDNGIRPTAIRARKALFDSLGDFAGCGVLDLCAGSGALALEAASRGARRVVMVEKHPQHCKIIQSNIRLAEKTGIPGEIALIQSDILACCNYERDLLSSDYIFADPPYAVSAELLGKLLHDPLFLSALSNGSRVIWELPDMPGSAGDFLLATPDAENWQLRKLGGSTFWCREQL